MAGIWSKQTCKAYAEPISILSVGWSVSPLNVKSQSHIPQGNIPIQRKRDGVHELGGIRNEGKERDTKELFIDTRALEDNIDHINEDF